MKNVPRLAVVVVLALTFRPAFAETNPGSTEAPQPQSTDTPILNVIVPHGTEEPDKKPVKLKADLAEHGSEDMIELRDVNEIVAIPDSAKANMLPTERQLPDSVVTGEREDGVLERKATGKRTSYYISDDSRLMVQGVCESIVGKGASTTRPVVIVSLKDKDRLCGNVRYPVAIKSVSPNATGIEPTKELFGSVASVAAGTQPDTIDVYVELAPATPDGKKRLIRGTFEVDQIPCLRMGKESEQAAKRG